MSNCYLKRYSFSNSERMHFKGWHDYACDDRQSQQTNRLLLTGGETKQAKFTLIIFYIFFNSIHLSLFEPPMELRIYFFAPKPSILSTKFKLIMLFKKKHRILCYKTHDYAILTFQSHRQSDVWQS